MFMKLFKRKDLHTVEKKRQTALLLEKQLYFARNNFNVYNKKQK